MPCELYGATCLEFLEVNKEFLAQGTFFAGADLSLGFSYCGSRAVIQFPETDYARLQIALQANAAVKTQGQIAALRVGQPVITSPRRAATIEYGREFAQLFLRIQAEALRRHVELLTGIPITNQVEFKPVENCDQSAISFLAKAIRLLVHRLDFDAFGVEATKELQQAIVVLFLVTCRHNFSNLLDREPKHAAPAHARRAADYIEANWRQPITMEALVTASSVSSRSLFKSFQKLYGTSPMQFVKRLRLQEARQLLVSADTETSVTQIAYACGFASLGHFARDYYDVFGELPSQTRKGLQAKPFKVVKYASDVTKQVLVRMGNERVRAMMESVAAGSEELNASVREISEAMTKSRETAMGAVEKVATADSQAQRLSDAAESMTGIVELINNITSQINLLALNATIESARAGEAGRGFAVVASEVKSLANQAKQATDKIGHEIGSLNNISGDVVEALSAIKQAITSVSEYVTSTAAAIEEQSTVTSEMSSSMQRAAAEAAKIASS